MKAFLLSLGLATICCAILVVALGASVELTVMACLLGAMSFALGMCY
jgi:hypothetical protein